MGTSAIWEMIPITQKADVQISRGNASNRPGGVIRGPAGGRQLNDVNAALKSLDWNACICGIANLPVLYISARIVAGHRDSSWHVNNTEGNDIHHFLLNSYTILVLIFSLQYKGHLQVNPEANDLPVINQYLLFLYPGTLDVIHCLTCRFDTLLNCIFKTLIRIGADFNDFCN